MDNRHTDNIHRLLHLRGTLERQTELRTGWRKRVAQVTCKPLKVMTDVLMYRLMRRHKAALLGGLTGLPQEGGFVVSLTSFPKRMDDLWMGLWSLWQQTARPCRVLLVLTEEEFPEGISAVPDSVRAFAGKGLEIVFTKQNLRPHNKYHYALSTVRHLPVITVDDDFIYYPDSFERLLRLHEAHPDCVCANRAHRIRSKEDGFLPYSEWIKEFHPSKGKDLVALGYACVLYPENFRPDILFDSKLIQSLSPKADDIWLKGIEVINNISVVTGDYYPYPFEIPHSQTIALRHVNTTALNNALSQNDIQWNELVKYFHISTDL